METTARDGVFIHIIEVQKIPSCVDGSYTR